MKKNTILFSAALLLSSLSASSQANIFASALEGSQTGNSYNVSFVLNAVPSSIKINVYAVDGTLVKTFEPKETFVAGKNTVTLDLSEIKGIAENLPLKWSVSATAPARTEAVKFSDATKLEQQFKAASDIIIDNNSESANFGRIYVSSSIPGKTEGRTVEDGIYILDANLQDVTGQGENAYTGNVSWANNANLTAVSSPHRLAMDADGNVFIGDWTDSHSGVWMMDSQNPESDFIPVFGGQHIGNGIFASDGVDIHGSISALCVYGKGENRVLYTYDEDMKSEGINSPILSYNIGTLATPWVTGPTAAYVNGSQTYVFNSGTTAYMHVDDKGLWVSQYRGAPAEAYPALIHMDKNGNIDFAHTIWDGNRNYSFAINVEGTILAVASGKNIIVNELVYDAKGIPSLAEKYTIETGLDFKPYGLAFDVADNIYSTNSGSNFIEAYALPKIVNTHETFASGRFEINLNSGVDVLAVSKPMVKLVSNILTVKGAKSVSVYNIEGVKVFSGTSDIELNVSDWSNGVYIVKTDKSIFKVIK